MSSPPFSKEDALAFPSNGGVRELVCIEPVWEAVVEMVYGRGLYLFPIPLPETEEESIPAYAVGVVHLRAVT